jgi:hypothetical protein
MKSPLNLDKNNGRLRQGKVPWYMKAMFAWAAVLLQGQFN